MAKTNQSADHRTIATDAVATIGMLIPEDAGRDAIHLATEPVIAGERLHAGQHIGFLEDGTVGTGAKELVGIVDPFLTAPLYPSNRFWLVVYPRTITSLRHVWTHPAFAAPEVSEISAPRPADDAASAETWLREYADQIGEDYDMLIEAADAWVNSGSYYYGDGMIGSGYNGKFEGERLHPAFWEHYEALKDIKVPEDDRHSFFTCAC